MSRPIRASLRWFLASLTLLLPGSPLLAQTPAPKTAPPSTPLMKALQVRPPVVGDIQLRVLKPGTTGNVELSVAAPTDARVRTALPLRVNEKQVVLRPAAGRLKAVIDFDVNQFAQEQQRRADLSRKIKSIPVFAGREVVTREPIAFVDTETLKASLSGTNGTILRLPPGSFDPIPVSIDPARELVITDPSIIDDPSRTFDSCAAAGHQGTPMGAWTFGKLMTDMANGKADPATMVENWLKIWETDQLVNNWTVANRKSGIDGLLLNSGQWPRLSNGKLDLSQAPMRLLAIFNPNQCGSVPQFTVILEYGVPKSGCTAVQSWAQQWHALGSIPLGTPAFNTALQAITDQFAGPGVAPGKNFSGSAIDQVRTDEVALSFPWELREFHLNDIIISLRPFPIKPGTVSPASHPATADTAHPARLLRTAGGPTAPKLYLQSVALQEAPVKQTPDSSLIPSATVTSYINANQAGILQPTPTGNPPLLGAGGTYTVPNTFPGTTKFLAGSSLNNQQVWTGSPAPTSNDARNNFSLGTCNACHGAETKIGGFTHVSPRPVGAATTISSFLRGTGTPAAPTEITVTDPVVATTNRTYGDIIRREQSMDLVLSNSCRAGGILAEINFHPLNFVD